MDKNPHVEHVLDLLGAARNAQSLADCYEEEATHFERQALRYAIEHCPEFNLPATKDIEDYGERAERIRVQREEQIRVRQQDTCTRA